MTSIDDDAAPGIRIHRGQDGTWTVTLHRERTRNAITIAMRKQLRILFDEADADDVCRAVVLTGADGFFSSGGDLTEMSPEEKHRFDYLTELILSLARCSKPVIAAIEGGAYGLGLSLALACDYIVASADARLATGYITRGLSGDGGITWTLPRRTGTAVAQHLLFSGRVLTAEDALRLGIVDTITEQGQALGQASALANDLALHPMAALANIKSLLHDSTGLHEQLDHEHTAQRALLLNARRGAIT